MLVDKFISSLSHIRLIRESGLKIFAFDGLDEAAEQAVQAAHA